MITLNDYRPSSPKYQGHTARLMADFLDHGLSGSGYRKLCRRIRRISATLGLSYDETWELGVLRAEFFRGA